MPGLEPGIHVFGALDQEVVDGRVNPGPDEVDYFFSPITFSRCAWAHWSSIAK